MKAREALKAANHQIRDDANELAVLMNKSIWEELPHQARIAIRREIERLREIAQTIYSEKP